MCCFDEKLVKVYQTIASNSALNVWIAGKSHISGRARFLLYCVCGYRFYRGLFIAYLTFTVKGCFSFVTYSSAIFPHIAVQLKSYF